MPHALRGLAVACAAVVAVVAAGCGGQEASAPPEQEITSADLALMPLPQEELGEIAQKLRLDDDSGPVGNSAAAEDTLDPTDSGERLQGAGRVSGHRVVYAGPRLVAAKKGKGVDSVVTEVELMQDTVYAAQHLIKQVDDYARFRGRVVEGVKVARVSDFAAPGIGDEAHGLGATFAAGKLRLHVTVVAFRRGRVVGAVSIARGDKEDVRAETVALAAALDARIQKVLAGEISGPPVAPGAADGLTEAHLPALTLPARDLPRRAQPVDEQSTHGRGYAGYRRSYVDVVVGRSHLRSLVAETQLYRTPRAAREAYRQVSTAAGLKEYRSGLASGVAEQSGRPPENLVVERLPGLGRGLAGFVVTFEVNGQRFRGTTVFLRSGRLIQTVSGICFVESLRPRDLVAVARRSRARLEAAVA